MRRIIIITLVALTGLTSVAAADRPHVRDHRGGVSVEPSRHRNYDRQRHNRYERQRHYRYDRSRYVSRPRHRIVVQPRYRYVRRPIYVQRPVIRYRYTNYYQRPAVIVENYPARSGYYWVPGQWVWGGYEWIWNPGHYEPDPAYSGYYSNTYDPNYYQANPYYQY